MAQAAYTGKRLVIESVVTVFRKRTTSYRNGKKYEYEYGEATIRVPKEFIGKKIRVIMIVEPKD